MEIGALRQILASKQGAAMLGVLAFLLAWLVQSFFASMLLNVVDAVFLCYAMDRDTQVSHPRLQAIA